MVRDKIPQIIGANEPVTVETRILDDGEYSQKLIEKLKEESKEVGEAVSSNTNILEELADVMEVVRAIAILNSSNLDDIEKIRANKEEKRGGFEKRILLLGKKPRG